MSVIGDILDVIKGRVEAITTGGGYSFDVGTVSRATRRGDFPKGDGDVVIYHEEPERNEELSRSGNPPFIAFDMPVKVIVSCRQTTAQGTTEPLSDIHTDRWEDLTRSVVLTNNWHTMGGNAINTIVDSPSVEGGDEDGTTGSVATFIVTYRISEAVPSVIG